MRQLSVALALLLLAGCSGHYSGHYESNPELAQDTPRNEEPKPERGRHAELHIPPGHFPPAGQCRGWIPGTPPGKQPKPGDCSTVARTVPAGAYLLTRPADGSKYVEVSVYDEKKPGVVVEVQIYTADTGEFVTMRSGE